MLCTLAGFRPNAGSGQPAWRPLPLKPALDTIHAYTASSGPWEGCAPGSVQGAGSGQGLVPQQRALPLVVRQMLSQHAQLEAIRRAEAVSFVSGGRVPGCARAYRANAVQGQGKDIQLTLQHHHLVALERRLPGCLCQHISYMIYG